MSVGISSQQQDNIDELEPEEPEQVVDQTALQVADIFNLDLTSCSSAEQGTDIVVKALYKFVEQYQQCVQEKAELEQQVAEIEQQQQEMEQPEVDEDGNPIEPEVDEDGNPIEQPEVDENGDPIESEPEVDENGDPIEPEEPEEEVDETEDVNTPPQQQPATRPNPFDKKKKKPMIQASYSPAIIKMAAENRRMKIDSLASAGVITGQVAKELKLEFASNDALTLSLSNDDSSDKFDKIIALLAKNGPVLQMQESTSAQSALRELQLSQDVKPVNHLVADAEARSKENQYGS